MTPKEQCGETLPFGKRALPCQLAAGHAGEHQLNESVSWTDEYAAEVRANQAHQESLPEAAAAQVADVTWEHAFHAGALGAPASCRAEGCDWTHPWDRPTHEMMREHNAHVAAEIIKTLGLREERKLRQLVDGDDAWEARLVTDWREVEQ